MANLNPQLVVYGRIVLYLFTASILLMFAVLHRERIRRARNFSLALFFLTIAVSLAVRLIAGPTAQTVANDYLTTPALVVYAALLAADFLMISRRNGRGRI